MVSFKDGVKYYLKNQNNMLAGNIGDKYIDKINEKINILNDHINEFKTNDTPIDKLKGNVAETWHADTLNINSALNGDNSNATVPRYKSW